MALGALGPLRSRDFSLLWSAALVSNVGTWMQTVALGIFVTARTHQPLWTGLVAAAAFIPNGLMAPLGGVMADRFDRRRWLLVTVLAEAGFASVLAVLAATGAMTPALAVLVAFLGGCCSAVGYPSYQAMLPDLVPKEHLLGAVSLSSAQYNLGRVVGPALAGAALVAGSYQLAFGANAISFGAVALALLVVHLPPRRPQPGRVALVAQIRQGLSVALGEPGCRSAIGLIAVVGILASPFIALVPAMAIDGLHLGSGHGGAVGTSVLVVAQGLGAVAGAVALPAVARRVGRRRQVVATLFAVPVVLVAYGLAPTLPWAVVALFVVGFCYIGILSGLNTVVQLRAPQHLRGRIISLFMLALGVMYPIGAVIQGAIGGSVGVRAVTVAGAGLLLAVLVVLGATRPGVLGSLGDPLTAAVAS